MQTGGQIKHFGAGLVQICGRQVDTIVPRQHSWTHWKLRFVGNRAPTSSNWNSPSVVLAIDNDVALHSFLCCFVAKTETLALSRQVPVLSKSVKFWQVKYTQPAMARR